MTQKLTVKLFAAAFCFFSCFATVYSQFNTWTLVSEGKSGNVTRGALVYQADSARFLHTLGYYTNDSAAYSEQMFSTALGKWINHFPDPSLYGAWGDSTGTTTGMGRMGNSVFSSPYFIFKNISYGGKSYLRPTLRHHRFSNAFSQYAYNPDDGKIYYFVNSKTFSYDTRNRIWDTIPAIVNPSNAVYDYSEAYLRWAAMEFDNVNNEILLVGGGGIANPVDGSSGVWTFSPSTRLWTKAAANGTVPEPRAYAAIASDPVRGKIVMFGGDRLDCLLNDTWVYDCATKNWERKNPAAAPKPRGGAALVYLPKSGSMVLIGGYEYTSCSTFTACAPYRVLPELEMWSYSIENNEWKLIKAFSSVETQPVFGHSDNVKAAADSGDNILAMATGDRSFMLTCDPSVVDESGTASRGRTPNSREYRIGVWEPSYFTAGLPEPDTAATEAVLRTIPENTWVKITAPRYPRSNHDWGTTVYDSDRDQILKFTGGHSAHCGNEVDMFDISKGRWSISYSPAHPVEYNFDAGLPAYYDFNGRPFVTHSYANYCYVPQLRKMLYIKPRLTFFYDPDKKEWDSVQVPNPAGFTTDYHLLVAEETSHGPIAWVRRNGSSTIFDLYLFDVENMVWRQLVTTGDALPNNYTDPNGVVYDSKRDRLLFFSENSGKEYVWEYSFETGRVTRSTPSGTPFSGYRRECVYMPNLDIVVIQGNRGYNCATNEWIYLAIANGAGVGSTNTVSSGYMYDKKRDIVWDSETRCDNLYALRLTSLALTSAENPNGSNKVNNKLEIKALPNPFNPVVSITTGLDGQTARIISIYDLSGRLVMESKADFVWDATLNPAGTYIVKVRSAGSETMKKITLLK